MIMPSVAASSPLLGGDSKSTITTTTSTQPSPPNTAMSTSSVECAGCGTSIHDRFYLSAVDRHWHAACLKCSQCKVNLQSEPSCFSRDGLIFCKADYYRLFTMRRCSRCGEGIYASELVMRVRDQNVYHIQCFTCAWCNVTLAQGDLFGIRDNLVYCRTHYEMLCAATTATTTTTIGGPVFNAIAPGLGPPPTFDLHHHLNGSPLHDSIVAETCSTMAATPYSSSVLYSPLSIGGGGGGGQPPGAAGPANQSPVIGQSIRKGRPRKRKNVDSAHGQGSADPGSNTCSGHETHSPNARTSPGVNSLDGGPLSGLAASIENSCNSQLSNSALSMANHQSGQRTKRMRTSFKHHQLRTMKTYFSVNQNPDAKDLKQLAQKTGLSKRVLQVWFQNARAKWRRNNLKMLPDGQELSLNGQTLLSMGHPSTPSTVIGSPSGSTRPFSSPSPAALSPSDTTTTTTVASLSHPASLGPPTHLVPVSNSLVSDSYGRQDQGLLPLNFQELY